MQTITMLKGNHGEFNIKHSTSSLAGNGGFLMCIMWRLVGICSQKFENDMFGESSFASTMFTVAQNGPLAQWMRRWPPEPEIPGSSPGRVRICSAISKFLLPWKDDGYKLLPSHICLCFSCLLLLPPYMRLLFCCLLLFCVPLSLSLSSSALFSSFSSLFFTYTLSNASPLNVFGCRIYSKRTHQNKVFKC